MTDTSKTPFRPAEEQIIEDLETLKVLADPLRLRIRELLNKPGTVKQIAQTLNIPATKLYYHINLLEKHGLIVVVDSRIVSGIIEKQYQVAAQSVRVDTTLLSATPTGVEGLTLSANTLFNDTLTDLLTSFQEGAISADAPENDPHSAKLHSLRLRLTEEQAGDLFIALETLLRAWAAQSDRNMHEDIPHTLYKLFVVAFPSSRKKKLKVES